MPAGSSRSSGRAPSGPNGCVQARTTERRDGRWSAHENGMRKAQAAPTLVLVARHHQADMALVETRHGGREEARREEDVGLDHPACEMLEFLDEAEDGMGIVDRDPPDVLAGLGGRRSIQRRSLEVLVYGSARSGIAGRSAGFVRVRFATVLASVWGVAVRVARRCPATDLEFAA